MRGIVKRFPGVVANNGISLSVRKGEVHALLGENGAGKSTLMNILYGLYEPDDGEICIDGRPLRISSPRDALDAGIGMVHQEFMLIPALTVAENVVLGMDDGRGPLLDLKATEAEVTRLAAEYLFRIDPRARVADLSVGEQQRIEILKALYRGARILVLDEPTAVLTPQETRELFSVMKTLSSQGHTIIFISHKLNEVMNVSDRVTVLRDGRVVATVNTRDTNPSELARLMVGREVGLDTSGARTSPGETVLSVSNLVVNDHRGLRAVKGVSLEVRAGEVLGIAGVDGNGQMELIEAITGLRKAQSGSVAVLGRDCTGLPPRPLAETGMAHIPGNRQRTGLILEMSVAENAILQTYYRPPISRGIMLNEGEVRRFSDSLISQYDIRTPNQDVKVKLLSGGNQQKVILARELSRQPRLLVAMHPTRGLDVGATEYVHSRILAERERGCAVLLVSVELEEILALSDRIAVMYEGEIAGILDGRNADIEEMGLLMAGSTRRSASCSAAGHGG
ncbi:MAG: ABC transporter ATP-binding protein [Firmicutes bacterium]|nr:ABC transporter ATP-binding protein [Bacillota bacterium]